MSRNPSPPSKNFLEQEAKRAEKSNNVPAPTIATEPLKEKKVTQKKDSESSKKKVIPTKKMVKNNTKVVTKPKEDVVKEKKTTLTKKIVAVKKKEKKVIPTPMSDKQITDAILEDVKEKGDIKKNVAEPELEAKVESSVALSNDGEGIDKPFVPFPKTEMTNTTTLMVNAYKIDCPKLPATILNELNKLNSLITSFVTEGRIELLSQMQGQDGIASQLLGQYVTDKGLVTVPVAGGIPAPTQNGIQVNSAAPLPHVEYKTPEFLANNPSNGNPYQVQIDQQGLAPRIVTDINYAKKCADDLAILAKGTFQFGMWGYVPRSVIEQMIATTNNQFKYEIVQDTNDFNNSYVKVISPEGVAETEKFGIQ